jgi:hypothetical protein
MESTGQIARSVKANNGPISEKEWVRQQLQGFEPLESAPWEFIVARCRGGISKNELVSLGQVCSVQLHITLYREYKRRKSVMLKWFNDHWDTIYPFLDKMAQFIYDDEEFKEDKTGQ